MASKAQPPAWFDGSEREYEILALLSLDRQRERRLLIAALALFAAALIASELLNRPLLEAALGLAGGFCVFFASDRFTLHAARVHFFDALCSSERSPPRLLQPAAPKERVERAAWTLLVQERKSWMRPLPSPSSGPPLPHNRPNDSQ